MTESEIIRFSLARLSAVEEERDTHAVGTLGEKPVHRTLKYFVEPDRAHHEVKHQGFVVDVMNGDGIFEVQTRAFDRLAPKLEKLLPEQPVTVIYPIIKEKRLIWIDPENGGAEPPRKVSKKGKLSDFLPELSKIRAFIGNENLTFRIYVLTADEYRLLDGYGAEKKKRATKFTVIPTDILEIKEFKAVKDLRGLLPENLPDIFSARQFYSAIGMRGRRAYFALAFCMEMGFIKRVGKSGKAYLYQKT